MIDKNRSDPLRGQSPIPNLAPIRSRTGRIVLFVLIGAIAITLLVVAITRL
jgi:hypothetical protein